MGRKRESKGGGEKDMRNKGGGKMRKSKRK